MVWDRVGSGPVEGGEGITIEDEGVEGNWSNGEALVIHDLKIHHLGQYRLEIHLNFYPWYAYGGASRVQTKEVSSFQTVMF